MHLTHGAMIPQHLLQHGDRMNENRRIDPAESPISFSYRPRLPDWGVYLRPPECGEEWIHPEDRPVAQALIPSRRILKRRKWDGEHYHLHYGGHRLRVRPTLWLQVPPVDLEVNQMVELLARLGANDAGIYRIADILYVPEAATIEFHLRRDELVIERTFSRDDLRPLEVHYELRSGYYAHPVPASKPPADIELLDVGDLLGEPEPQSDAKPEPDTER